jgi:hypothetical protein
MVRKFINYFTLCCMLASCHRAASDDDENNIALSRISAQVTHPAITTIADSTQFYGTTQFLRSDNVSVSLNSYIRNVLVAPGDNVTKGEKLFTIQSKEASAYKSDTTFGNGTLSITSPGDYIVSTLHHQNGDYVQEGEILCTLVDPSSLVITLSVPFNESDKINVGSSCEVILPGGKKINAVVTKKLLSSDSSLQTQQYRVQLKNAIQLPEKLTLQINFSGASSRALSLPREAVLSNETLTEYWVMKMINDSTAVKEKVHLINQQDDKMLIRDSALNVNDRVLLNNNYGLPDTVKVIVTQ